MADKSYHIWNTSLTVLQREVDGLSMLMVFDGAWAKPTEPAEGPVVFICAERSMVDAYVASVMEGKIVPTPLPMDSVLKLFPGIADRVKGGK